METTVKLSSNYESFWIRAIRICVWSTTLIAFFLIFLESWKFNAVLGGILPVVMLLSTLPILMGVANEFHDKISHLLGIACFCILSFLIACYIAKPSVNLERIEMLTLLGLLFLGYLTLDQTLLRTGTIKLISETQASLQRRWLYYRIIEHEIVKEYKYDRGKLGEEELQMLKEIPDEFTRDTLLHPHYDKISMWKNNLDKLKGKISRINEKIRQLEKAKEKIGCFY
jgi:hypothetical protein